MAARSKAVSRSDSEGPARLQKVMADAGVGSRRECEQLIVEGRVEVDRVVVRELGTRVDPQSHEVRVDGTALPRVRRLYYAVNKPMGVVSTNSDPDGRPRVVDLIPTQQRLFTVGRLDRSSEGLMLVTNDGDLAQHLAHPRFGVPKTYVVEVTGSPSPEDLELLRGGVHLAEGKVQPASIRSRRRRGKFELEIVLQEGRNREIRRMLARIGHKVTRLKRVAIGPLRLGTLPVGEHRPLTASELDALQRWGRSSRSSTETPDKIPAKSQAKSPSKSKRSSKSARPRSSSAAKPTGKRSKSTGSARAAGKSAGKPRTNKTKTGQGSGSRSPAAARGETVTSGAVLEYEPISESATRDRPDGKTAKRKGAKRKTSGRKSSGRKTTNRKSTGAKGAAGSGKAASRKTASGKTGGRKASGSKPSGSKSAGAKGAVGRGKSSKRKAGGGKMGSSKPGGRKAATGGRKAAAGKMGGRKAASGKTAQQRKRKG